MKVNFIITNIHGEFEIEWPHQFLPRRKETIQLKDYLKDLLPIELEVNSWCNIVAVEWSYDRISIYLEAQYIQSKQTTR